MRRARVVPLAIAALLLLSAVGTYAGGNEAESESSKGLKEWWENVKQTARNHFKPHAPKPASPLQEVKEKEPADEFEREVTTGMKSEGEQQTLNKWIQRGVSFAKIKYIKWVATTWRWIRSTKKECNPEMPCEGEGEYCADYDDYYERNGRCLIKPPGWCEKSSDCPSGQACDADSDDASGECIASDPDPELPELNKLALHTRVAELDEVDDSGRDRSVSAANANAEIQMFAQKTAREQGSLASAAALAVKGQIEAHARSKIDTPACGEGFCDNPTGRAKFNAKDKLHLFVRWHILKGVSGVSKKKVMKTIKETAKFYKKYNIYIKSEVRTIENDYLKARKIAKKYDLRQADRCTEKTAPAPGEAPDYPDCLLEEHFATVAHPFWMFDPAINVFVQDQAKDSRLGFAKFPWNGRVHGLVFLSPTVVGKRLGQRYSYTFAHELGHALGLKHTHQGQEGKRSKVCGSCGENYGQTDAQRDVRGDFCSDTPVTPKTFDCRTPSGTDQCSGKKWKNTMYKNLMGYAKGCRNRLTMQQRARIQCWAYNGHRYITKCRSLPDRNSVRYRCEGAKDTDGTPLNAESNVVRDAVTQSHKNPLSKDEIAKEAEQK